MEYEIIRGKNQIGGTITEIRSANTRIWADFGMELSVQDPYASDEQMLQRMKDNPPDAVLFTHIRGDHIGLLYATPASVKVYLGPSARDMMLNIRNTLPEYEKFEYPKFEAASFEPIRFEAKRMELPQLGITFLRRGVIGMSQIDYTRQIEFGRIRYEF